MCLVSTSDAHRIFDSLDKNNDGILTLDELNCLLQKVGVHATEDELACLVGNNNGLDCDEFCYFYESILSNNNNNNKSHVKCDRVQEEEVVEKKEDCDLYKAFKVFDLNGDDLISSQELETMLWKLGMWSKNGGLDMDRIMSKFDVNSDGFVDFSEFKIMMLAH